MSFLDGNNYRQNISPKETEQIQREYFENYNKSEHIAEKTMNEEKYICPICDKVWREGNRTKYIPCKECQKLESELEAESD